MTACPQAAAHTRGERAAEPAPEALGRVGWCASGGGLLGGLAERAAPQPARSFQMLRPCVAAYSVWFDGSSVSP